MILSQYLIVSRTNDGTSLDLIVTAVTPQRAVDLWRKHYDGWDLPADDIRVFEIPPQADTEVAHEWDDSILDTRP